MAQHTEQLRSLHLFAGAGGGLLADLLLGHRTIGAVEIEEYPRNVLLQRQRDGILPEFPIWDDVRSFDGKPWRGHVDIVAGGFPCTNISCAGDGTGLGGKESSLWFDMARVIGEVQPRFVFVENSPLLVSRGLNRVLSDLASMGYDARWGVIGFGDAGGNHQRNRLWIVATANGVQERGEGEWDEAVARFDRVSWCQDVGGGEDVRNRFDLPEPVLLRSRNDVANYVDRTEAIGNGQIPAVAALAWRVLGGG